ncbi:hypothetical protein V565_046490 [Rhizoctonia solani 123E]|uniref:Uncharacterized protein n=1 Tax=Rhizoctonia solani 123E TaxID=1423351 RepID=A0A074S498_9AGAM|nr:hypothetical protein V565_046490 [Rhizoctonia solani 123E]
MATTHSHEHDDLLGHDLPPPAYELTDTELDRKIADAAQRSLSIQQERPVLPPLDQDGFPIWSEELFKYNEAQRQREDESRSAKLRSEYTHAGTQPSGSSGSPPSRALVTGDSSKKENKWWFDSSAQVIAQDERPSETQNMSSRPPSIQVQVGPRPHDILAQPQSPTSDVDEDEALTAEQSSLGRAPTYYPMGQIHPGHAERLERNSTRESVSSIRTALPAFTPEAESLEGPAYEEVVQGRPWRPLNVRPQSSRVSTVPYASATPPPRGPVSVPPPASVPVSMSRPPVSAPPRINPAHAPATSYMPTGYSPPAGPRPTTFDPSVAYRPAQTQRYTLTGRVNPDDGMLEAQRALREGGAGAFYTTSVAATMQKAPAFQSPAPPPPRVIDDNASVFSGRSTGSNGARMSVYAPHEPVPNRSSVAAYPGYQPAFQSPPSVYQTSSRPLPNAPGFSHAHGFIAPPPPPGVAAPPGKKPGKLYKRL